MTDRETLERLHRLDERAVFHVAKSLARPIQILEGRRRIGLGAAWLVMARDNSDHREAKALNRVGYHLRSAQQILDRELAE